ncbi:LysR substrate-binding domain-containing protein [Sphingomonas colocasiae]|uniref:LysR substrate-binding domain-containing protein n=1 Tax=Sphingomonas colocasiae TaxID=1848973 RepID=UPI0031BB6FCA
MAKAADEIALSQSAASMALRDLEAHLGVDLFAREGKRLLLSDYGRQVQARASSLLRQAEELEKLTAGDELVGRLRLGATPALAHSALSEACGRFTRVHPGVVIDLSVAASIDVIAKVHRMSLDMGFIGSPTNRSDLETRDWIDDRLAIFCAPDHPCARRIGACLTKLLAEDWALEKAMSSERISLTMEALKHLSSIRIVFESDSIDAVKAAVRAGGMIGCLSRRTLTGEFARGELIDLEVPDLDVPRRATIIWKKDSYQGQLQSAFLDFVGAIEG